MFIIKFSAGYDKLGVFKSTSNTYRIHSAHYTELLVYCTRYLHGNVGMLFFFLLIFLNYVKLKLYCLYAKTQFIKSTYLHEKQQ